MNNKGTWLVRWKSPEFPTCYMCLKDGKYYLNSATQIVDNKDHDMQFYFPAQEALSLVTHKGGEMDNGMLLTGEWSMLEYTDRITDLPSPASLSTISIDDASKLALTWHMDKYQLLATQETGFSPDSDYLTTGGLVNVYIMDKDTMKTYYFSMVVFNVDDQEQQTCVVNTDGKLVSLWSKSGDVYLHPCSSLDVKNAPVIMYEQQQ